MAKILKRLLLIIPILFLFPKSVFADTNNIYFNTGYNRFQFEITGNENYTTYNFNALDSEFTLNYFIGFQTYSFSFVLYDKVNDYYVIFIPTLSRDCSNSSIVDFDGGSAFFCDNSYASINNRYFALLSNKSEVDFINNIFNQTNAYVLQNGDFYLSQNGLRGWSEYYSYVVNNYENFELVYKDNDYTLTIKGHDIPLKSSSSPEEPENPEPEDPEEDMPILNYNQIKYYVPDYQDSQCIEVLDKDTIRVFNDTTTSYYTDYYVNNHYISKIGQVGVDYEKNCSTLKFTSDYKYRNDFPQICFITLVVIGFTILPCYMLFKVFYKRG